MRIVYDGQAFQLQRHGGISRYFVELASRTAAAHDVTVLAPLHVNRCLRERPSLPRQGVYLRVLPRPLAPLVEAANTWASGLALRRLAPDVLHETCYAERRPSSVNAPVAITVHDMIHERYPHLFPGDDTARRKAAAVRRADHIFCVSHATRDDLTRILGVDPHKTTVTHLGCDFGEDQGPAGPSPLERPYLLFVGDRGVHKNFPVLLAAFASSIRLRRDFSLVCFGAPFSRAERALITTRGLGPDEVRHAGGGDSRLRQHYRHAAMLVAPSLYEGFGLTPLEAMSFGCPVVASRGGSLPEILGDAAEYAAVDSIDDLREAIERVAGSRERQAVLRTLGRARASGYTWAACTAATLDAYRRLG